MDGFLHLLASHLRLSDIPDESIKLDTRLDIPGYYRPTKSWDLLVVHEERLLAAIEVKSQTGPSFGNNFNNRVEEAIGSAQDIHTAFRERAFGAGGGPWLGYLMLLEDCDASQRPVGVREPFFPVFPEFKGTSYAKRYALLGEKLVLERLYNRFCLILTRRSAGQAGHYDEPSRDLSFASFITSLVAQCKGAAHD